MVGSGALFHAAFVPQLNRLILAGCLLLLATLSAGAARMTRPNVVYILCDDLGYGDVRCLNPQGKIPTPHMDRLAAGGMIFTDAHSSSAVCTPSRYSLLTGRYNWRSAMKRGVLNGFSPRLIETNRVTVAAFLKDQGYATACLGKWHLGMNWPQNDGSAPGSSANPTKIDYTKPIHGGPTTAGFDYYYGISASLDMAPFVFIENDRVTEVPTVEKEWVRTGPAAQSFEAIDVLPVLTRKAVDYIAERAPAAMQGKPFFLYLPLSSPHTPILPTKEWRGKSGLNAYADFVMQTDATVGAVLDALEEQGLAANTLVIVTSDNGCSPEAKFHELVAKGHNPSHVFRGHKADIFEGGHRVPFLVRWPARVKAGTTSDQLICQTDFFATCAAILGKELPDQVAEDSVSFLPALAGRATRPLREAVVHHSINGSFSIRQGQWKLELCPDSGGWSDPRPGSAAAATLPTVQLYDLSRDIGETNNVSAQQPRVVAQLTELLEKYIADGRSTPGKPQPNTGRVELDRAPKTNPAQDNATLAPARANAETGRH
jgi:arylsulfatase A-like enzyme